LWRRLWLALMTVQKELGLDIPTPRSPSCRRISTTPTWRGAEYEKRSATT